MFKIRKFIKIQKKRISEYEKFSGFTNTAIRNYKGKGVTLVRDKKSAKKVLDILYKYKNRVHSWDTETIDLDIKSQSPVGNGKIISAQLFCGPDVPFENGPRVFIDNFGECKDLILLFKDYFEDESLKKVWFNYGFDRHIFFNHGINCLGFEGDSMHMARLLDGSREPKAYSLNKISIHYQKEIQDFKEKNLRKIIKNNILTKEQKKNIELFEKYLINQDIKQSMNVLFARRKLLKNGEPGKIFEVI